MSRIVDVESLGCLIWKDGEHGKTFDDGVLWVLGKINELPTIDPERKTGKWIKVNGKTAINCSICHHCRWSLSFEDTVKRFNFCPKCGAKMEGSE